LFHGISGQSELFPSGYYPSSFLLVIIRSSMSSQGRIVRRLIKTFLPIILVILVAFGAVTFWIVRTISRPPRAPYLVTPKTFSQVTGPVLNATDATWPNHDGTTARGWLLNGAEGAPAVILLHGYGADRSWLLNLAVKLNETTNFNVLWPDLRGHGENPNVNWSLFGTAEGDDTAAAVEYLRTLKGPSGRPQVGGRIGLYGTELGAYAALDAARRVPEVRALALDSVPASPNDLINAATTNRAGMNNAVLKQLARWGVRIYSLGKYHATPACDLAPSLRERRVLLLTGADGDPWRASTLDLARCFSDASVETKKDMAVTGPNLPNSTGEQEETYDRPVIEFFDKTLR
jgi:pimeloyl-ACP methyl ester carboxylesterase